MIPRTEEPGGLQSTGLQRVRHISGYTTTSNWDGDTGVYWGADNVLLLGPGSSYLSGTGVSICTNPPSYI